MAGSCLGSHGTKAAEPPGTAMAFASAGISRAGPLVAVRLEPTRPDRHSGLLLPTPSAYFCFSLSRYWARPERWKNGTLATAAGL